MTRVDDKEVIYTTTLLLAKDQIAYLSAPELLGVNLQIQGTEAQTNEGKFKTEPVDGDAVKVLFPFTEGLTNVSFDTPEVANSQHGRFSLRFAGQPVGNLMVVNVAVYLERRVSFAPR